MVPKAADHVPRHLPHRTLNKHVLIIGGSGMLCGVARHYLSQGADVSVLARHLRPIEKIAEDVQPLHGKLWPVVVDYGNAAMMRQMLVEHHLRKPFSLVIAWVHSEYPHSLRAVDEMVSIKPQRSKVRLFQLLGSSHVISDIGGEEGGYRSICLSSVVEGTMRRWLSHEEICTGVIHAIQNDQKATVIGDPHCR